MISHTHHDENRSVVCWKKGSMVAWVSFDLRPNSDTRIVDPAISCPYCGIPLIDFEEPPHVPEPIA